VSSPRLGGTWRPFSAAARAFLLDAESRLPVRITVFPADGMRRRDWELRFGLPVEEPNTAILDVRATSIEAGEPDPSLFEIPGWEGEILGIASLAERLGYRPVTPTFTGSLELATTLAPPEGVCAEIAARLPTARLPARGGGRAAWPVARRTGRPRCHPCDVAGQRRRISEPAADGLGGASRPETTRACSWDEPALKSFSRSRSMPVRGLPAVSP
jgi:hypothetical protein